MNGVVKSGVQTSEFWLTLLAQFVGIIGLFTGIVGPELALSLITGSGAVYAGQRGYIKRGALNATTIGYTSSDGSTLLRSGAGE